MVHQVKKLSKLISEKLDNWSKLAQCNLYPATCFICNNPGHAQMDLCQPCLQELQTIPSSCSVCGVEISQSDSLCGKCLKTKPYFDKVITPYRYQGTARFLIQSLKFQKKHCCARIMGTLMAQHISRQETKTDALIAVPLHPTRLKERGFNQSEEMAQYLHKQLNIPVMHSTLKRTINTVSQASLQAPERRKNLKNAFHYQQKEGVHSVAIIDDVVTTGSTANEIARTLKQAGVKHVEVWAFARA